MFGNTRGWVISGAIFALVAILIVFGGRPPQVSPSSGRFIKLRDSANLSVEPVSLGIRRGDEPCDAADLYRKVIEDYKANKFRYVHNYTEDKEAARKLQRDNPQFLQWVVEAANCAKDSLFKRNPSEIVNYNNNQDSLDALRDVGNWASTMALLDINAGKFDEAEPYLRGAFLLGQDMYFERLRWDEYVKGTELMNGAANGYAKIAQAKHDDGRADQIGNFVTAINTYEKNATPLWQAISGVGIEGQLLPYPGDIFDFAEHAQESMWRTEAILKLGRMKYMGNLEVGDQRGARRVVKSLAGESDLPPGVKAAANAARDLTVEEFRLIGGGA